MKKLFLILFMFVFCCMSVSAEVVLAPNSTGAILIEASTNKILYEKNKDEKLAPASMTKIMTFLLVLESLEKGNISLNDEVLISKNASGMGGTQIFIEANTYVSVEDLIKGLGIASANDAAVALAEYVGGTEDNFVEMMNKRAKEIGCKNTNFMNPHGLDEEGHYSSAYDMALIASELVKFDYALDITSTYEEYITVSGEKHWLVNTNKLVRFYEGIDGLKTGYTDKAKYCLTATMNKNDMRLISVVMGVDTKENRTNDTVSMMEYGYSMFGTNVILKKDEYEGKIFIKNAKNREVKYFLDNDIKLIVDKNTNDIEYSQEVKLEEVKAPLKKGDRIGTINIKFNDEVYEYNLVINEDVKEAGFFQTYYNLLKDILSGNLGLKK